MVVIGVVVIGGIELVMSVFELLFLFNLDVEVDVVMIGFYYDYVVVKMFVYDLILLLIWENGFCNLINNKYVISKVEDFVGLNFCVMQNLIFLDIFCCLGVNFVLMVFGEVFIVLEIGVVDGQENLLLLIQVSCFYEV